MWTNRQIVEDRIFEVLTYIKGGQLAFPLKQNINLFSTKELQQMLDFLESGSLDPIYQFLDDKYKEYLWLMEELKMLKVNEKKQEKIKEENTERKEELTELETLINF